MYSARTWKEIKSWPKDKNKNYHIAPNGTRIKLGYNIDMPYGEITFGDCTEIGNHTYIGKCFRGGERVKIGNGCEIGNFVNLGNNVTLEDNVVLNDNVKIGNYVKLKFGESSEKLIHEKINELCRIGKPLYAWKWVTKDRKSPNFDLRFPVIEYHKNSIIEVDGPRNDKQYDKGIHLCTIGTRLEYTNISLYVDLNTPLIHLLVEYKPEDILFPGLPGYNDTIRVRKIKVLE